MTPATIDELREALADARRRSSPIGTVDLRCLSRVRHYAPEDMTITVEAGVTLGAVQEALAVHNQWLPLDPPDPATLTIADLLASNASGPRRLAFGTARDHVIGLTALLPDGRLIDSGGRVVKNVAGYDLAKLFIGGRHALGLIVQATFKVRPRPELERFLEFEVESLATAGRRIDLLLQSPATPIVLDLHRIAPKEPLTLVVGFGGSSAEVEWQIAETSRLGFPGAPAGTIDYWARFWQDRSGLQRWSVLPSQTTEALARLDPIPFVAHAGNGILHVRGGPAPPAGSAPPTLIRRLKATFDPHRLLPDF